MQAITIGERFSVEYTLSEAEIAHFATLSGDFNPLHHDPEYARRSRYGSIIACGPHTVSLMLGLTATHFTQSGSGGGVGLEYSCRFRRAVKAGEAIHIEWIITNVEHSERLGGDIVFMEGRSFNDAGEVKVTATGKILVTEHI
jgi:3-hydroxybutyryl-CoA dehydratase